MEKTIFKYPLTSQQTQIIQMPKGAQILTLQMQKDTPCIWALLDVDIDNPKEFRTFELYGTGHPIYPRDRTYIGSFQVDEGHYIFHVFELLN